MHLICSTISCSIKVVTLLVYHISRKWFGLLINEGDGQETYLHIITLLMYLSLLILWTAFAFVWLGHTVYEFKNASCK